MNALARTRSLARAFTSLSSSSSSVASVSTTTARVWTSAEPSSTRVGGSLGETARAFAASASPRVGSSAFASSDDGDDAHDGEAVVMSRAPKPTKHKNHIKRMAQRDAARRENARKHKEGKRMRAVEREEKRLERWRGAVAMKEEYARRNASGAGGE